MFLEPRFIAVHIPEDVGISAITAWIVEEGAKFVPSEDSSSEDSHVGCQITENSQGNKGITQEEPVHKIKKIEYSYLRASKKQSKSEDDLTSESYCKELKRYMIVSKPVPESKPLEWWK